MEKSVKNNTFANLMEPIRIMIRNTIKPLIFVALIWATTSPLMGQNPRPSKADNALDFGIYVGGSNYLGELTQSYLPVWSETHLGFGAMVRYNMGGLSLRASAMYMRVSGDDKNFADDDEFRARRNLSFRSNIYEFSAGVEWNLLGWQQTRTSYPNSPYLFASIGAFRFNPMAQFVYVPGHHDPSLESQDGSWVELQPLSTEAQETTINNDQKRYSLTQVVIPFGLGYKFQVSEHWTFGIEFGMRKTFTDYLDDISTIYWDDQDVQGSGGFMAFAMKDRAVEAGYEPFPLDAQRGNPNTKDWYMFGGINITYRILGGKDPCPSFK